MITKMTGLPESVLGFEAKGRVSGDDYSETLMPAVESALDGHDKIRFLFLLGDEFVEFSTGAAWDDAKMGMQNLFSFERVALVTDHEDYRLAVKGFGFLMPGKVKVFATAELDEAKAWAAEN
jgi:hypothetical protein